MAEIRSIVMSKKAPEWKKANPERTDVKELLNKTKKFAEMYLKVLEERRGHWKTFLEKERKKEEENGNS